jgi:hypothetical protein
MKFNARNTTLFTIAVLIVEFVLVPYGYFLVFPLMEGSNYFLGLLLLSLPRVVLVLGVVLLMKKLGGLPLWTASLIYAAVLAVKFFVSEIYIQSGNAYALGTAVLPYAIGLVLLVVGALLLWPRDGKLLKGPAV